MPIHNLFFKGVDKLDARCFVRNLTRRGVASTFMKDMGRQRVTCFVARRFTVNSATNNEIEKEKKKHEGLTRLEEEDQQPANPVSDLDEKSTEDLPKPVAEKMDVKTFLIGSGIQVSICNDLSC